MWDHLSTILTVLGFLGTAGVILVTVTWRLSIVVTELKDAIAKSRDEIEERQDRISRDFGETAAAIRQKVHEIETWARDEFVRKDSFESILTRSERTISEQFREIKDRLERMEGKIDARQ